MNLWGTFKIALRALSRNKMRSILTMLGIIIGVAAVIAVVGIGQGASAAVQAQISQLGNNMLYVFSASNNQGGLRGGQGSSPTLVPEDVDAIERECPSVRAASPGVRANGQLVFGNQNWAASSGIQGTNEKFSEIRAWPVDKGEFFTEGDVRTSARVCVLGKTVADNLFAGADPIGQTMRIRNLPFRVIGILSAKGQNQFGQDQDDTVIVPYTTAQKKMLTITWIHYAMVSAISPAATFTAERQITELLRQRHRIAPNMDNDFSVRNLTDVAEAADESSKIMTNLLASVAIVSLMVGGIGIMNIMLVSVTERTREIGIRMAIGARSGVIRRQFLIESITLSLVGGLIGVVFGIGASIVIARTLNWPMLVSPFSIAASVLFSMLVGIAFGYYPARKAASLDPIDALRYE
ncbi:MAG TPA: ABC transporter permease [Blastocatellia bacterium]|nr:ABC transporter permease [Blastocatellia bacterium]